MTEFLDVFGVYDFAIRDGLVMVLAALAVYLLLNAGVFALPQVGMMAIGAYVAAILAVNYDVPLIIAAVAGAAAAAVASVILALLLGRLNGIYLAIASIAFSEIVRIVALNLSVTGKAHGIVGVPRSMTDPLLVGVVLLVIVGIFVFNRSRRGLAVAAMRVDPLMAQHQGINVTRYRIGVFTASGLVAGLAGAVQVHVSGFVEPSQFSFDLLTQFLAMVVIGGMTYLAGPLVGAVILLSLPHVLTGMADYQILVNGALIVAMVAFAPGGIVGVVARRLPRRATSVESHALAPGETVGREAVAGKAQAGEAQTGHVPDSVPAPRGSGAIVLDSSGLTMNFGGVIALNEVGLTAHEAEVIGIIGPNGSGKTTLINVLSGAYRPTSGMGSLTGTDLAGFWGRPDRLANLGIARTFQTIRLMEDADAVTNVALGVKAEHARDRSAYAQRLLDSDGLGHISRRRVGELPYGIRRRVEIARALAREPRLLLLDEPTAGMNPQERADVFATIASVRESGLSVVVVEHDVEAMRNACDRLLVLDFGRVIAQGHPQDVLNNEEVIRAYIGSGAPA